VDKVLGVGYDGVYLDILDAYQYWEPGGPGNSDHPIAEDNMVEFVKGIVQYARLMKGRSEFQVFVQNAKDLLYNSNRRQPSGETAWSVSHLDRFKDAGKPVLVPDYATKPAETPSTRLREGPLALLRPLRHPP
jgi:endo-alpha-1,4-polygalactosaminidase (GH114 family)